MRFHVIWRKSHEPEEAYRDFFETNDIYEAKDFAMRLAFDAHKPTASGHTKAGGDFYAQTQAQPGGLSL